MRTRPRVARVLEHHLSVPLVDRRSQNVVVIRIKWHFFVVWAPDAYSLDLGLLFIVHVCEDNRPSFSPLRIRHCHRHHLMAIISHVLSQRSLLPHGVHMIRVTRSRSSATCKLLIVDFHSTSQGMSNGRKTLPSGCVRNLFSPF